MTRIDVREWPQELIERVQAMTMWLTTIRDRADDEQDRLAAADALNGLLYLQQEPETQVKVVRKEPYRRLSGKDVWQ